MFKKKFFILLLTLFTIMFILVGCSAYDKMAVTLGIKNNNFEYIKQSKVDKIVIQSARDTGFMFIITEPNAINDMYKLLSNGNKVSEHSSLDPDYYFEIHMGDDIKKYNYIVGADERGKGNFFNDEESFSISNRLDDTIIQNLSFIRKPRNFQYVYYQTILSALEAEKLNLDESNKVGIDISGDIDCLKYILSTDLQQFEKNITKVIPNAEIIKNNSSEFDTIIKVKNRGYNSTIFKTMITIDNKKDKVFNTYYISAEYNFRNWDIDMGEVNKMPNEW
ncbi:MULTISPECIES: hypothetical protein [Clostridium]|uniref:hypothetical protein n=1 Tax=Clostridium TaxID=1485 RepID=UPI00035F4C94|nr:MULTISPECIES: hypothetical protein [Clostridium]MBN1053832.1 hypothetical protein [Clostridium botulinum]NFJ39007.1 hypothetical protein [Clostridium botulinum B str. Eklund 17B (NRP)]MBY6977344.1 hypothetical protein [Clostridium botulinum]MBY7001901.1 hypothetical protein [Clostridium botulinum]MCR1275654.1 hypothetical protein [Clostridium botulinum]